MENNILDFALNKQFLSIADKYAGREEKYEKILSNKITNIKNSECIIPILGLQGSGKSTFLNALIFGDIICPVEANETTSIPTIIKYNESESIETKIFFQNNTVKKIEYTDLNLYVDNNHNPLNEKKVDYAEILINNDLLKNDVVFVDLPGVGSITKENTATTLKFIESCAMSIFLLKTSPPLTRSEAIFIKAVLPKLTSCRYIINHWDSQSFEEYNESKNYIFEKLKEIYSESKIETDIQIHRINSHQAINSRLENDEESFEKSGLKEIADFLKEICLNWKIKLIFDFTVSIKSLINEIKYIIKLRLDECELSDEELKNKFKNIEEEFKEKIKNNQDIFENIKRKLDDHKIDLIHYSIYEAKKQKEILRNQMRETINSGLVDGEYLTKAFEEKQKQIVESVQENLFEKIYAIRDELLIDLEKLEYKKYAFTSEQFEKKEAYKWEKCIPFIGNIGSSGAGYWTAAAVSGAIGGSWGGPIGILAGVGVALIGMWVSSKSKEVVLEKRKKNTLREIDDSGVFDKFEENLSNLIKKIVKNIFNEFIEQIDNLNKQQENQFNQEKQTHKELLKKRKNDIESLKKELESDYKLLIKLENELK